MQQTLCGRKLPGTWPQLFERQIDAKRMVIVACNKLSAGLSLASDPGVMSSLHATNPLRTDASRDLAAAVGAPD
eukprot:364914-Chlamydomonas_euryale.AAC.9